MACVSTEEICGVDIDITPALAPAPAMDSACVASVERVSGFLTQPEAVSLAGRLLQLPLGLFLENIHSVWQHVSKVTLSLLRVYFLLSRGCPAAFGVVLPRAPMELRLARVALLFLAVCPPPSPRWAATTALWTPARLDWGRSFPDDLCR